MRHRRRLHTQTVRRKSHTQTGPAFSAPGKKISFKIPLLLLLFAALAASAFIYRDDLSGWFDSLSAGVSFTDTNPVATETPAPVKKNNTTPLPVPYTPVEKRIQLEILNGCGEQGVARQLTQLLKDTRYDIVNSGNYIEKGKVNWDVAETRIIDQVGNSAQARELADKLGVLYSNVDVFENPSPIADITIIIGKDYKTLHIFQ